MEMKVDRGSIDDGEQKEKTKAKAELQQEPKKKRKLGLM
jgi:hypothetical protein